MSGPLSHIPTLTDGVVRLRAHQDSDIDRCVEQSLDPLSIEWTTVPTPYTRDDAATFVRHVMPGGWQAQAEWGFAVEYEGRYGGTVSLRNRGQGRAEIAFGAHPDVRGRGVMARALRLLLGWGFEELQLITVIWCANRGNWASRRLAWRIGFSQDGTLRGWLDHRGAAVDAWTGTLRRTDEMAARSRWLEIPRITGGSVVLRPAGAVDLLRVVETRSDPELQRWLQPHREQAPHTLKGSAELLDSQLEDAASGAGVHWAVADRVTDAYLGQVSVFGLTHRHGAELGYWAHPDARGRGLTTEACHLAVRHCFVALEDGGLGLRRLSARATVGNDASHKVLERVGFVRTGVERQSTLMPDGSWRDTVTYDRLSTGSAAT